MYESSSSVCFSSSSACSSSAKALTQNHSQSPHSRPLHDIPVPPLTGALRAAGRTFSLGGRLSKLSTPSPPTPPPHPQHSTIAAPRERSMTGNAARATSPPKLLDTGLSLGTLEDDFQSAFDNIGLESGGASQERFPGKPIDPV